MEYTAHHEIEPALQKHFTQVFEDHMDRNNPADRKLLGDLLSGYRYRQEKNQKTQSSWYQDLHQAAEAYRMAQCLGCKESCNRIDELLCLYRIVPM